MQTPHNDVDNEYFDNQKNFFLFFFSETPGSNRTLCDIMRTRAVVKREPSSGHNDNLIRPLGI